MFLIDSSLGGPSNFLLDHSGSTPPTFTVTSPSGVIYDINSPLVTCDAAFRGCRLRFETTTEVSVQGRVRLGWAGLGWAGLGWAGLGWAGLGWQDQNWIESVRKGDVGVGQGGAGLGKAGEG